MSGPNSQSSRCGCEYGGPCTRTTVCAVTSVRDEMQQEIDRLTEDLAQANATEPKWKGIYTEADNLRAEVARLAGELADAKAACDDRQFTIIALTEERNMLLKQARTRVQAHEDAAKGIHAHHLELLERIAALESREVCTQPHDDVETCGYCQRDTLQAQVAGLREALTDIAGRPDTTDAHWIIDIARAALAGPTRTADQPKGQGK